ncbi:MAG: head GIN domain-containing protein [Chitinophagaceae bacterium]
MKPVLPFLFFILFAMLSCDFMHDKIRGNGVIKTETRSTGNFSGVDVSGNIDVYLKQDSSRSVRIEADENLMEYIVVKTDGDELVIETKEGHNLSGSKDIKVYVSSPVFSKLEASGACSINSETVIANPGMISIDLTGASDARLELNSPKLEADLTGASSITLKGQSKDISIEATGASHARCFELMTENAAIAVTGASRADVFASVSLRASASGASHIKYKGNAAVSKSASGASSIDKAD